MKKYYENRIKEERNILHTTKQNKANWVGHTILKKKWKE
jgi:hypothetical protein